ncbi:hypothetical protein C0J52_20037 [Blattella germanica]|nr:hypothetical protein C0J52_20037 [Blattella germanica]
MQKIYVHRTTTISQLFCLTVIHILLLLLKLSSVGVLFICHNVTTPGNLKILKQGAILLQIPNINLKKRTHLYFSLECALMNTNKFY